MAQLMAAKSAALQALTAYRLRAKDVDDSIRWWLVASTNAPQLHSRQEEHPRYRLAANEGNEG
ncbi:hypothetical protein M9458_033396, partial [Cirrhinus mrigala]